MALQTCLDHSQQTSCADGTRTLHERATANSPAVTSGIAGLPSVVSRSRRHQPPSCPLLSFGSHEEALQRRCWARRGSACRPMSHSAAHHWPISALTGQSQPASWSKGGPERCRPRPAGSKRTGAAGRGQQAGAQRCNERREHVWKLGLRPAAQRMLLRALRCRLPNAKGRRCPGVLLHCARRRRCRHAACCHCLPATPGPPVTTPTVLLLPVPLHDSLQAAPQRQSRCQPPSITAPCSCPCHRAPHRRCCPNCRTVAARHALPRMQAHACLCHTPPWRAAAATCTQGRWARRPLLSSPGTAKQIAAAAGAHLGADLAAEREGGEGVGEHAALQNGGIGSRRANEHCERRMGIAGSKEGRSG